MVNLPGKIEEDFLAQPRPDDPVQQVHHYARDLAYLVMGKYLESKLTPDSNRIESNPHANDGPGVTMKQPVSKFRDKWGGYNTYKNLSPEYEILVAYGYLEPASELQTYVPNFRTQPYDEPDPTRTVNFYRLTAKAFELLEKPAKPPTIFISYRRVESSAFALLIEARLRLLDIKTVFVDKQITAGEDWEDRLRKSIKQCEVFICLIGPTSLNASMMVEQEIEWALNKGCEIRSVWHNGYSIQKLKDEEKPCPPVLEKRQAIVVTGESAREYETAINELLNSLDYKTY